MKGRIGKLAQGYFLSACVLLFLALLVVFRMSRWNALWRRNRLALRIPGRRGGRAASRKASALRGAACIAP